MYYAHCSVASGTNLLYIILLSPPLSIFDIDTKKKVLQVCTPVVSNDLSINRHFCSAVEFPDPFAILIPMAVFCLIAVAIVYKCVKNMRKGLRFGCRNCCVLVYLCVQLQANQVVVSVEGGTLKIVL